MASVIKRAFFSIFLSATLTAGIFTVSAEAVSVRVAGNGLVALAKSSPSKGLVAIHVSVIAGSSLEAEYTGSGISHLVEHMVFKGTKTRGPGAVEKEAKSYGAFLNGSVDADLTNFYITVPPENFAQAIALVKDILSNALFDNAQILKEKEVIVKEINLGQDDPGRQLIKALKETAYLEHPYKYPVIGYEDLLRALTRDDLLKYYNRMYVPAKMVISAVGDIDEESAISAILKEFGDFGRNDRYFQPIGPEMAQICKRERSVRMPVELAYLAMGFHSTSLLNKDLYAADVLAMILGRGDNSRLNTALLKKARLAHSVSAWNYTPREPGLFVITATLDSGMIIEATETILSEIDTIKDALVSDEELESAKRMALSDYIFSLETAQGQADMIATGYIMTGSADFAAEYVKGIGRVSKEDLKAVARKYLAQDGLNVVRILPSGEDAAAPAFQVAVVNDIPIQKKTLSNGLRILVREDRKTPTVSITAVMLGGVAAEDTSNNGISSMVSNMLLKGTSSRKEDRITGAIEKLGGHINAFSGFNGFGISIETLKEDLPEALEILKDVLTDPSFPQEELEKETSLTAASIKEEDDDIFASGSNALRKDLFAGSPYALRHIGEEISVLAFKREDLVAFYRKYGVAGNMVISISGDVEAQKIFPLMQGMFGDLEKGSADILERPVVRVLEDVRVKNFEMDKKEALVMLGFRAASVKDSDRYALDLLASVLSGHSGRMFDKLRGRSALAYTLGCTNRPMLDTGYMLFYIATTKDNIAAAEKELLEVINLVRKAQVDKDELTSAKKELCLGHLAQQQSNAFFSTQVAVDELYGLGCDNVYRYQLEIDKVTTEDLKRCAVRYLAPSAYAEVIISPKH